MDREKFRTLVALISAAAAGVGACSSSGVSTGSGGSSGASGFGGGNTGGTGGAATGCNPSTCAGGCCDETGGCQLPATQNWTACGPTGGGLCSTCSPGVACSAGTCTTEIDTASSFLIYAEAATVLGTWDLGNDPDVFVCFDDGTNSGCTSYVNNDPRPTWDATTGLVRDAQNNPVLFPGTSFIYGLITITVYDYDDVSSSDLIGSFSAGYVYEKMPQHMTSSSGNVLSLDWHME